MKLQSVQSLHLHDEYQKQQHDFQIIAKQLNKHV